MNYRNDARESLTRAERELGSADNQRVRYAALELRMAMEALTYDRALAYKDEFPPDEYEKWQPRKVMAVLLDIDPRADRDCSLAFAIQEHQSVPASVMTPLGSEKVLNMAALREHYDALGSYLHLQSMKQARAGKPQDFSRLRSRCEEIAALVREVLSSPLFNVTVGNLASLDCKRPGNEFENVYLKVKVKCAPSVMNAMLPTPLWIRKMGTSNGSRSSMNSNAQTRTASARFSFGAMRFSAGHPGYAGNAPAGTPLILPFSTSLRVVPMMAVQRTHETWK